ncbi:MAG: DNA polymerase III subunit delta, partial [Parabacteroides sp.]
FQVKDYAMGIKNYSAMKVFNLISDIRTCDAKSKGVENISFSDGELLKELIYKILH